MFKRTAVIIVIGAGLVACSSHFYPSRYVAQKSPVSNAHVGMNKLDSLILPYQQELEGEMNRVIATAAVDFVKERPNSNLGQLTTDLLLAYVRRNNLVPSNGSTLCILNHGGLRSTLNKGEVNVGDIYKLMPFDNELLLIEGSPDLLQECGMYLKKSGGEPIGGMNFLNGAWFEGGRPVNPEQFWVLTSDYLYEGGDKMDFLKKGKRVIRLGVLIRDALLQEIETQKHLTPRTDERIRF